MLKTESLYCPIRKKQIASLPEERIRQKLIQHMISSLGYPLENLSMEKSLKSLPHVQKGEGLPKRRADLIVFANGIHPLHSFYPLLLIECKAVSITQKTMRQLIGYNHYVQAYFIAAANETTSYTGWFEKSHNDYQFEEGIPPYNLLIEQCPQNKKN